MKQFEQHILRGGSFELFLKTIVSYFSKFFNILKTTMKKRKTKLLKKLKLIVRKLRFISEHFFTRKTIVFIVFKNDYQYPTYTYRAF